MKWKLQNPCDACNSFSKNDPRGKGSASPIVSCRWSCCYSNPLWGKIIRHSTVCVSCLLSVFVVADAGELFIYTTPLARWLVLFAGWVTGWSSIQLVIGCNKSGTNPLLAWAPPPLAGRSSFLSSFMACQQLVKFILLYFLFVLTCPASVMLMCCVCLCSCFCQAGPSYLTPPLPVYIAITCWRTLNQSNKFKILKPPLCWIRAYHISRNSLWGSR